MAGTVTTGASNDIEQATKLARAMVTRFGMKETFGMVALATENNRYLGGDTASACSAETLSDVDGLVVDIIKTQYQKALDILTENREKLHELAVFLYRNETISGKEFTEILNA